MAETDVQGAGAVVEGHPHRAPEGPQVVVLTTGGNI